jgi:hypothetical protein
VSYYGQRDSNATAWVVIVGIVAVFGLLVFGKGCCTGAEQRRAAKTEAQKFAAELGLSVTGVSCNDVDSDGDGYVSCTLALTSGETKQIECRGAYSWGHGCRDPKLTTRGK